MRRLAVDGAAVAIDYRPQADAAERLAAEINTAGGHAITMQGDVAVADESHRGVESAAGGLERARQSREQRRDRALRRPGRAHRRGLRPRVPHQCPRPAADLLDQRPPRL
ncbi:hypothetical protein [Saccharothrix syringae]|uniref:hypothetical protein n=1 Tax=Saccharothrix syringae TaxID=103733 RepID=UPI00200BFD46|nr:hypothetical protein [Saccharothrix syringae]